jgi:hypothetical protein
MHLLFLLKKRGISNVEKFFLIDKRKTFRMDETKPGLMLKNIEGRVKLAVKTEAGKGCKLENFLSINQDK